MRSKGARVLAAGAALALVGCGGSNHHGTPKSTVPVPAPVAGSGPGAATAEITNAYTMFINSARSADASVPLLQDGEAFKSTLVALAKSPLASKTSVTVSSVTVTSANKATVVYSVLLAGSPVLTNQTGYAVRESGAWKIAGATFCTLLTSQGQSSPACSVPAATALPS